MVGPVLVQSVLKRAYSVLGGTSSAPPAFGTFMIFQADRLEHCRQLERQITSPAFGLSSHTPGRAALGTGHESTGRDV